MNLKKNKWLYILLLVIIFVAILVAIMYIFKREKDIQRNIINNITTIKNHYNGFVKTNKESSLYDENGSVVGKIGNNIEIKLEEQKIDSNTKYFKIIDFEEVYYIKYQDVQKINELSLNDGRYKKYIVFNQNIITDEKTTFYDEGENLVYEFNKSFKLPIIIKDTEKFGVEFNGRLLYIKSNDVVKIEDSNNTEEANASGVGVLNYHAFYDENNAEEKANCNTEICHSNSQFKEQLDYLQKNNILTIKMNELEMYIDGKIQLPKSVLITIDDGGRTKVGIDLLSEYQMYATIFLITSWFDVETYYKTDYIEFHSHTHNMHQIGQCPGGQGGGIKCLSEDIIQSDLKQSRAELNGTTAFAYPFYEYNEYSIKMLKEAGFTMAFIGESYSGDNLVHVSSDKFRLKRFVIVTYTTLSDLDKYFGQIR